MSVEKKAIVGKKSQNLTEKQYKTNLKYALFGKNPNVYTIAIVTLEKTMDNNVYDSDHFEKLLYTGNFNYTKIKNNLGKPEYFYVIYNVPLKFIAHHIGHDYNQKSFVFITRSDSGCFNIKYVEKETSNPKDSYRKIYVKKRIQEIKDIENFFYKINEYDWNIPFKFSEDAFISENIEIQDILWEYDAFTRLSRIHSDAERKFIKDLSAGKLGGMCNYYTQCSLYRKSKSNLIASDTCNVATVSKHIDALRPVNMCLIVAACSKEFKKRHEQALKDAVKDLDGLEFKNVSYPEEHCIRVIDIYDDAITFTEKMCWLAQKYENIDIIMQPKGYLDSRHINIQGHDSHDVWTEYRTITNKYLTTTKEELDKLYNVPYSCYGRDYCTLSSAHIAYWCRRNLKIPNFPCGYHPYGETWTAKEAEKHGWYNISKIRGDLNLGFFINLSKSELEEIKDWLRRLGYVYKTLDNKPIIKVMARKMNSELFKEDMLMLGKKYNQETILLKLKTEPSAYYFTTNDEKYGLIDTMFDDNICLDNKTLRYISNDEFRLKESEYNDLPEEGLKIYTGNGFICRGIARDKLLKSIKDS